MKKHTLVLHPIFFILYPVILTYSQNVNLVHFLDTIRPMLIALGTGIALLLFFRLFLRDWIRAGLIISWFALLFFTYGHVYYVLEREIKINPRADILAGCWAAGLILGTWWIVRKLRRVSPQFTYILNITGAAAVLIASVNPAVYFISNFTSRVAIGAVEPAQLPEMHAESTDRPDIYYIILDGFGRADVLDEIYGVDNNELLHYLEDKGFYIVADSHSNYVRTLLSIPSSLNFQYLDKLIEEFPDVEDYGPMKELLENNAVAEFLRQRGYRFEMVSGGVRDLEIRSADQLITAGPLMGLSDFEIALLSGSALVLYLDQVVPVQRRAVVNGTFIRIVDLVDHPGPKFVFAHVFLPHPPFLFDHEGNPVVNTGVNDLEGNPIRALNTNDGNGYLGDRTSYIEGYREQAIYTSQKVKDLVREILGRSKIPPVIILQGDHGPGAFLDWSSLQNTCVRERFSILNAIYLPGKTKDRLYPEMSPVNTFRVVFNEYFDAGLDLLGDRSIYSVDWRPYDFQLVDPDTLNIKCPTP